jgi:hypothetical protein
MASFDEVKLEDILHCSFATFNPDTGANKDADSLPTAVVYEEGSSTALTSTVTVTNMTTGRYRLNVTIAAADGYEAGKYYELWASATVTGTGSPVTQSAPLISFKATTSVVDDLATQLTTIETSTTTTIPALIPTAGAIADQVWDEATAGHTTSGTYGGRVVRSTNSNVEVQITGSNHIAADVHEFQTGVITAAALAADAITAAALAADAVTEIQSGLALETSVQSTLDRLGFTLAALAGNCADPQTAAETYSIILGANTFTIDHTGLDATGTRTTATLTKS